MIPMSSVLCPIDFSGSSRGALRYAGALAGHFGGKITVLAVNDPLLTEAADIAGDPAALAKDTIREMERFWREAFAVTREPLAAPRFEVSSGKPAPEILRVARESGSDLIVMASHGSTGFRKLFFGSTTERVLRETTVPMLVTSGVDPGPTEFEDIRKIVRRVLVPVDLTGATARQLAVARDVAEAFGVPLVMLHVIEPVRSMAAAQAALSHVEAERRYRVETALNEAVAVMVPATTSEALIAYGEPAEEIAKVAQDREAGLIVMGLHSSPMLGPRMGSVTYRVLCLAHRLILALPPAPAKP